MKVSKSNKAKKNLSPYAIKILRKVQKSILKQPKLYNQLSQITECGAPMCIMGWANFHSRKGLNYARGNDTFSAACEKLNISYNCGELLWDQYNWPKEFIFDNGSGEITSKVGCERIDHFIKTDGKE